MYYSYEYCSYLNSAGIDTNLIIICHRKFSKEDYIKTLNNKYIHCDRVYFDSFDVSDQDISFVLGRSMITLSWQSFNQYSLEQQKTLKKVFSNKIISVYSDNHPTDYPKAIEFYFPRQVVDLCDKEVYPNGIGEHFEKTINFDIYKSYTNEIQFKYLFLGTNREYYKSACMVLENFSDHGILTYDADYIDKKNNNVFVPVDNLIGLFETFVYTKETFDPAPRIIQECKYYGKDVIYHRDTNIIDGGSVYWKRDIKPPNVIPILNTIETLQ